MGILVHAMQGEGLPVGSIISFYGLSAPDGYLICDGSTYNRSEYPFLAKHLVSQFPDLVGNGTTTFKVPDLRGEFLRGTGTNSHANCGSGSGVGTHQDGTFYPNWLFFKGSSASTFYFYGYTDTTTPTDSIVGISNADGVTKGSSVNQFRIQLQKQSDLTNTPTFMSPKPTNTSVLYCIKY